MESIVPEGDETVVSFMLQSLVQEQSHSGFSSVGAPFTTRWRRSSISCISSRVPVVVRQRLVHIGHGEAFVSEVRLPWALVRFAETFHTWRLFAEEQLELDLDMLLSVTQPVDDPAAHGIQRRSPRRPSGGVRLDIGVSGCLRGGARAGRRAL